jgi:hypothetical protein
VKAPPTRPTAAAVSRDPFVDALRAGSLLVVVVWHWAFSYLVWKADGPHSSNPIGTTTGLWLLTWVFQVMPVFFWVGGYAHRLTWESVQRSGGGYGAFVRRRLGRLLAPAAVLVALAAVVRVVLVVLFPDVGSSDLSASTW